MPPNLSKSHEQKAICDLRTQEVSGFRVSGSRNELVAAIASSARKSQAIGLRVTVILAVAVYALAVGASALLNIRAPILDGVPLCLGAAAFLCFYSRLILPRAVRAARTIEAAFIVVALGLSLACLSYLGAITDLPLRDGQMIWIDRHLDFDWLQIMSGLDCWPAVLNLLDGAYATFTSQLIATVLVLIVAGRTRELDRFFVTFVCASVIAEIASVLLPTLGPMSALAGHAKFANLSTLGRATGEIVLALRRGTLKTIDLDAINGIISFPSLHAAVAVIVPFTLRWNKPIFWPIVVLDSVMLISAIPSGNHYLTDVLGGLAVAVVAIVCGQRIQESLDRLIGGRMLV
jgi:membrane-associated phospholipid phosphatase